MAEPVTLYCGFCEKSQHEVATLIAGPKVHICNECVGLCAEICFGDLKRHGVREGQASKLRTEVVDAIRLAIREEFASSPFAKMFSKKKRPTDGQPEAPASQ